MQTTSGLSLLLRSVLVAGALVTSLGTGVAFADGKGHGHGHQDGGVAAASTAATTSASVATASVSSEAREEREEHGHRRHGEAGVLKSVDTAGNKFVLTSANGRREMTVVVNGDTIFHMKDQDKFTLADLATLLKNLASGQRILVNVQGQPSDGGLVARRVNVHVLDANDDHDADDEVFTRGTISDVSLTAPLSVKVTPAAGGADVTFTITATTEITLTGADALAKGQTVTVVADKNAPTVALRIRARAV